ncbi:MAG: phosphatase PAP2 family protein [Halosimplex sp.]
MTAAALVGQFGEAVRAAVPTWTVPLFRAVTRLGNVAVFLALFALDYWFGDAERGAHAVSLAIAGMALITALKAWFAAPRPPRSVHAIPISGYGFPSGHATGAAIAYGTLARDLTVGSRRLRYGAAAVVVALVALSRVVLGVHFVRDVVAGVAIGVAFLGAAVAFTGRDPRRGFLLAVALALLALLVAGPSRDATATLGAAVGAAAVWEAVEDPPAGRVGRGRRRARRRRPPRRRGARLPRDPRRPGRRVRLPGGGRSHRRRRRRAVGRRGGRSRLTDRRGARDRPGPGLRSGGSGPTWQSPAGELSPSTA